VHSDYDYLIIGGGMAADAAAKGIREIDASGTIGIVGEEPTAPFPRPDLSKKLWTDPNHHEADSALHTQDETHATLHLAVRAQGLDVDGTTVTTDSGETFGYGRLLIATGGHPRQLPRLEPSARVIYFRTLDHYRRLRAATAGGPHVAVVGAGFIGSELTSALSQNGCTVTLVHPGEVVGANFLPSELAEQYERAFVDAGVTIRAGVLVDSGSSRPTGVELQLSDGSVVAADLAVVGLGIEPAGAIAGDGGIDRSKDGGIVVDERLSTSAPDVYAAGDVAEYPDAILGRRRVEHVDNATQMGRTAGRIMAGADEVYDHTPFFYSDVFDIGYEAVGTLDAELETVVDTQDDGYVVYYLDGDQVVGVLLWNVWDATDQARAVLRSGRRPDSFTGLIT
jgi:3-phenylpropionate/trans-cinnamate dioxygenase ferredoxin reductase subunit